MKKIIFTLLIALTVIQFAGNAQTSYTCGTTTYTPTPVPIISGTVNASSLGLTGTLTGATIVLDINSTLVIDANSNWNGVTFLGLGDSKITVPSGVVFNAGASSFQGCNFLWQGIEVLSGGSIGFQGDSIKDAKYGIQFNQGVATSSVIACAFENNYIGIYRKNSTTTLSGFPVSITNNIFYNNSIAGSLKPEALSTNPNVLDGSGILSTVMTTFSFAGIYLKYTNINIPPITNNRVFNMHSGAILFKCQDTRLVDCKFKDIANKYASAAAVAGVGIYNDGFPINNNYVRVSGGGTSTASNFDNTDYGIKNINANMSAFKLVFNNTNLICISHRAITNLRGSILADSNNFSVFLQHGIKANWSGVSLTPSILIRGNSAFQGLASFVNKTCFHIEGLPGLSTITWATGSTIFGNNIFTGNTPGVATRGVYIKDSRNARVVRNTFTLFAVNNTTAIDGLNIGNGNISCNQIGGSGNFAIGTNTGIRINTIANSLIRCNNLDRLGTCISILGTASTPTALVANAMTNAVRGIVVATASNIGNQILNGNEWIGTGAPWATFGKLICTAPITWTVTSPGDTDPTSFITGAIVSISSAASANCGITPTCTSLTFKTDHQPIDEPTEDVFVPLEQITLYPNPATEVLFIKNTLGDNGGDLMVMDMQGKQLLTTKIIGVDQSIQINHLQSGTYILKVVAHDQVIIKKFIKQ
jgi:Secretion system C-terminal sorting domain